jgi:hypothetical protein
MAGKLLLGLKFHAVSSDDGESPLVGGKVYAYVAGTSTLKDTYSNAALTAVNTNPVILNAKGEASIFLSTGSYKFVLKDANDVVLETVDEVTADAPNVTGTVAIANGGTGQVTANAGFNALSPMSAAGDVIYGGASGAATRLAKGTANQLLHSGTTPSFSHVDLAADVSTTILPYANGGSAAATQTAFRTNAQQKTVTAVSADGAISVKDGLVVITKGSACILTLAAPTATTDDGKELLIFSTTAFAHTVTNATPGFNNGGAASDVGTFSAAIGNYLRLEAYNGVWYVSGNVNVTLA